VLILASWYMLGIPGDVGGQRLIRVLARLRVVGALLGLWVMAVARGVVIPALTWPMLAAVDYTRGGSDSMLRHHQQAQAT